MTPIERVQHARENIALCHVALQALEQALDSAEKVADADRFVSRKATNERQS